VRGTKLGGFRGYRPTDKDRARAIAARRERADEGASRVALIIAEIRATGAATSLRAVAVAELDTRGIPVPRGGRWTATAVMRVAGASNQQVAAD
jgi:hypothetical protein